MIAVPCWKSDHYLNGMQKLTLDKPWHAIIGTQDWIIGQGDNYSSGNVVVNFLSQLIFIFLLFLGMVMNANEFETKEI